MNPSPPRMALVAASVFGLVGACVARAQSGVEVYLSPQRYIECQIAARQATIVGLEERMALINRGADAAEHRSAGEKARGRVTLAFYGCGYTAGTLGAYAHRYEAEVAAFLAQNPSYQSRLDAAAARVTALSAQMRAVPAAARR